MKARIHPLLLLALAVTALWALLGGGPDGNEPTDTVALARPERSEPAAPPVRPGARTAVEGPLPGWPAARGALHPDSGRGLMDGGAGRAAAAAPARVAPPPPPAPAPAVPPPAPAAAAAPARPAGPPLTLMGVVHTDTPTPAVFFTLGEQLLQARVGETIDGRFRIDAITATQVVVTVQPENQRVVIPIAPTTATPGS